MRIFLISGLCVLGLILASIISVAVYLVTADFTADAQRYATKALDRKVTIGSVRIHWGNPIRVEVDDLHLANAPWGSEPEMLKFAHASAVIEPFPLLRGQVVLRHLVFDHPEIFLERDQGGIGNWKFKNFKDEESANNRGEFPVILDMELGGGVFRMKTSSGAIIHVDAEDMRIAARDAASPVITMIRGTYNGIAAQVDVIGASYNDLHNAGKPYPINLRVQSKDNNLEFIGTMTDPVNVDGASGVLLFNAPVPGDILTMAGMSFRARMPLRIDGDLTRTGDHWKLKNVQGRVADSGFKGALTLDEGAQRTPDAIGMDLIFAKVDLKPLIDGVAPGGRTTSADLNRLSLRPDAKPGVTLDVKVKAQDISYESARIANLDLALRTQASLIDFSKLTFNIAQGQASMQGRLDARGDIPHLSSMMSLSGAEIGRAIRLTGEESSPISGPFNARATLEMNGENVLSGLKNSNGGVVVYMNSGKITRSFLEKASLDVRTLLRKQDGNADISCLIAVYDMHNGFGEVLPLRLYTSGTGLTGGGIVNLMNRRVDITLKSKPETSSSYALNVPMRFTGPFSGVAITPVLSGDTSILDRSAKALMPPTLVPALRDLANKSDCLQ